MAVKYQGLDEKIMTPIDDSEPDNVEGNALGWQCPQNGLAIHDLVWKHRPELHTYIDELGDLEPGVPGTISEFMSASALKRWIEGQTYPETVSPVPAIPPMDQEYFFDLFRDYGPSVGNLFEDYNGLWDETGEPFLETLQTDPEEYAIYHSVSHGDETLDYIFLQFWMFENYSTGSHFPEIIGGYPTVVHEGDIEYMQTAVRLVAPGATDSKSDWFMPIAATASQHYYAQTLRWLPDDGSPASQAHSQAHVEHRVNTRPVIYVAQGSHATFFVEDADICGSCVPDPKIGNAKVYDADCQCVGFSSFDRTAPASPDEIPSRLIALSTESWLDSFEGRWGYYQTDDPQAHSNGPPGPPHRAATAPDDSPVNLRYEPCRFHNLAILRVLEEEVRIYECPSQ